MNEVYLLTGGNMGDRVAYLSGAEKEIARNCGTVVRTSSIYETEAWGLEDQEPFLNQVLCIQTHLPPEDLMQAILIIESGFGRKRNERYGPRLIDIDILLYNDEVVDHPGLKIPHPRMQSRRFVLTPLAELAPGKIHPVLKKSIRALLDECNDPLKVNKIS
jgi:2-amino-4-hydroxy-6-hydroxymethyldihydropteridine diphosphokinase